MFGLDVIGVGIGLIVIYLLLSLVCTATNEVISNVLDSRAKTLRQGVEKLFADTGFTGFKTTFFEHSLIKSLAEGKKRSSNPSYIPAKTFSKTMLDLIAGGKPGDELTWDRIAAGAAGLGSDPQLEQTLRVLVGRSNGSVRRLEKEIEAWFDSSMARVSSWYKKKTHNVLLLIALVVAGVTNADTFSLVRSLTNDAALRSALVAQAEQMAQQDRPQADIQSNIDQLQALGVPIGWRADELPDGWGWIQKIIGLIVTAAALSLGAPFWFDLLKRAVNIRSVGRAPEETARGGS